MPLDEKGLSARGQMGGLASGVARNQGERNRLIVLAHKYLTGRLSGKLSGNTTQDIVEALVYLQSLGHGVRLPSDESSYDPTARQNPVHFLADATGLSRKSIQLILKNGK